MLKKLCFIFLFVSQVTYQNFGRYYYNIRQCAAADLGSMTWLAMHCDSELDWICKIPRGTVALELLYSISCFLFTFRNPSSYLQLLLWEHHSLIWVSQDLFHFIFIVFWASDILYTMNTLFLCVCVCLFSGSIEKEPEVSEGQSYFLIF